MFLCLEIIPGTSKLVEREIRRILGQREVFDLTPNLLLVKSDDISEDATLLSLFSRAVINLYFAPKVEECESIEDLYQLSKSIPWPDIFSFEKSFAVVPKTTDIDKKVVGRLVGQGVIDRFLEDTQKRPAVDLKSPELEIAAFIVRNKFVPAIKLFKNEMNTVTEAVNRLATLCCNKVTGIGEIFHAGICESAFEFFNQEPQKERILESAIVNLLNVDYQKILDLVAKSWRKQMVEVFCFSDECKTTKIKYREIRMQSIESLRSVSVSALLSNLTLLFPGKEKQREVLNRVNCLLTNNDTWEEAVLIVRADIDVDFVFNKAEKVIDIAVMGIPSRILRLSRR
ncbi:MAG: THUMP domain-containing protein [Crenarchaeota archaeon]|nr:THUMP domain-containing protein [Thermoproteota archaeon]MCR8472069.1 THUMP domain-containing protein [Thermoproteota archaeon]MCR8487947.1 THUMP domain-containing protein [Thermoproteota archaeon]